MLAWDKYQVGLIDRGIDLIREGIAALQGSLDAALDERRQRVGRTDQAAAYLEVVKLLSPNDAVSEALRRAPPIPPTRPAVVGEPLDGSSPPFGGL